MKLRERKRLTLARMGYRNWPEWFWVLSPVMVKETEFMLWRWKQALLSKRPKVANWNRK